MQFMKCSLCSRVLVFAALMLISKDLLDKDEVINLGVVKKCRAFSKLFAARCRDHLTARELDKLKNPVIKAWLYSLDSAVERLGDIPRPRSADFNRAFEEQI